MKFIQTTLAFHGPVILKAYTAVWQRAITVKYVSVLDENGAIQLKLPLQCWIAKDSKSAALFCCCELAQKTQLLAEPSWTPARHWNSASDLSDGGPCGA